jgi:ornithine carbamoyltransferase
MLKHILTGEELNKIEVDQLVQQAILLKQERLESKVKPALAGQHLALLFDKLSLRTRFSFTVAMRELGGDVIESLENTRKLEDPEDQARVLSGYCHGIMIRTHADKTLERMSQFSEIPIINGLSNLHHPCQIFADLMTLYEHFKTLSGITLSYIGDGNNILHSLLLLAPQMGINIHYCCPDTRGPDTNILEKSIAKLSEQTGKIVSFTTPEEAVVGADAVYTDVWTSMGFETKVADHLFANFQVNETLMQRAKTQAVFMHCLPMERGKEVSANLPDLPCSLIFQQSENRLHVQKALLLFLLYRGDL